MVPSRFRDKWNNAGGNCHSLTLSLDSSVVRVFGRSARDAWLEAQLGHVSSRTPRNFLHVLIKEDHEHLCEITATGIRESPSLYR